MRNTISPTNLFTWFLIYSYQQTETFVRGLWHNFQQCHWTNPRPHGHIGSGQSFKASVFKPAEFMQSKNQLLFLRGHCTYSKALARNSLSGPWRCKLGINLFLFISVAEIKRSYSLYHVLQFWLVPPKTKRKKKKNIITLISLIHLQFFHFRV